MSGSRVLDKLFPPFKDSRREKPREMVYVAQEKPDTYTALVVGATHAMSALMLVVYMVIAGRAIGLDDASLHGFVALEIVVMGAATVLQSLKTRFSSGHLIVHIPSTIGMASFVVAATQFGIGAAAGGLILSALVILLLARFFSRLQPYFPPEVAGVLLVLLGLTLVEAGVSRFTGISDGTLNAASVSVAGVTLAVIVAVAVWTQGKTQVLAVVFGVVAGLLVSVLTGSFGAAEMAAVTTLPVVALPMGGYAPPLPTLVMAAALPMVLIGVMTALDSFGTGVAIDRINNAKWRRPDLRMVGRLVSAHGIGVLLNGLTGTLPTGTSSANLGLVAVTGVAARRVGTIAGLLLIMLAFLPPLVAFMVQIPVPVVGAIIVYTAGYMLVVGMQLLLSRMLNSRRIFTVGLSITVGASLLLMPELRAAAPPGLEPILGSPLTLGVLTAVVLNLLFRIGISETASIALSGIGAPQQATRFLEELGADWGARPDVINRAGVAVGEALEVLHGEHRVDDGPVQLKAHFDEYKLTLVLDYQGRAFSLKPAKKMDLSALLDADDDSGLDAAISGVSSRLLNKLADKVSSVEQRGRARLRLQFAH